MKKYALLIIDADNDFVDPMGSLYIKNDREEAKDAIIRLSHWIDINANKITNVYCTMDSHSIKYIGFPGYWTKGKYGFTDPRPGETISLDDWRNGKYTINSNSQKKHNWIEYYLMELAKRQRKQLIWPIHSLDGTWGQAYPKILTDVFVKRGIDPKIIRKGDYDDNDMSSIFEFDVPIIMPGLNEEPESRGLMRTLMHYDKILICGFAKDYSVASSVASLIATYPKEITGKLVFLRDGMVAFDNNNPSLNIFNYCVKQLDAIDCLMNEFEW